MLNSFTVSFRPVLTRLLLFSFIALGAHQARATHAMGSDLRYECLGGNTYRFTLRVYRDCQGSALNPTQVIAFQSASCGVARFVQVANRVSITELSPLCPAQQPNSTCNGGILPGVEEHVYELVYTLPTQCSDWNISWQLCCRNYAITNSVITPSTRIYIESYLNNLISPCNNSPYFTVPPTPYLCEGEPFQFNNGAIDPDGDSLAFELVDPQDFLTGTNTNIPIPYVPGFSKNYPMATSPANTFNFDGSSGQFSFVPNGLQQGIVALLVKEYRNGVLIGSTMRDIQMVVINCANQSPVFSPPFNVSGGLLTGNTFSICAGSTLSFQISGSDPDLPPNQLDLSSTLAAAIPNASFSLVGNNPVNGTFSWPTTPADIGTYFFTLTLKDDGCPNVGQQTVGFNVIVDTEEILPPQDIVICPVTTNALPLSATTPNPGGLGSYSWSPPLGLSNPSIRNPIATINGAASYVVSYTRPGECPVVEPVNIIPEAVLSLAVDSAQLCNGASVQLGATLTPVGAPVPVTFTWDPPAGLSNPFIANPVASPSATTVYTVTATTLTCSYSAEVLVIVDNPPLLNALPNAGVCAGDSVVLTATGANLAFATFAWVPTLGLSAPGDSLTLASPAATTTYTFQVSNQCGSDSEDVTVTVAPPLNINLAIESISCNGANDGFAEAFLFGGGGNPVFAWTPALSTGPIINNLPPGPVTLIVTDAFNCRDTASAVITEPAPLVVNANATAVTCPGYNNGTISVSATGGTPTYLYSLNGGPFLQLTTFSNLSPGPYTLTAQDAQGCQTTIGVSVPPPGAPVQLSVDSVVNTNCLSVLGEIHVSASGGSAPYQYSINGVNFGPSGDFTGLVPGLYPVTVQDSLGCSDTELVEVLEVADPYAQIDSVKPVSCAGGSDGLIQISGVSGTQPYLYSINGSTPSPNGLFTGLGVGSYSLSMTDAIGCKYDLFVAILQPDSLLGSLGFVQQPSCNGGADGAIVVLGQGGSGPIEFSLNGGSFQGSGQFGGLSAGTYQLVLRDSLGCTAGFGVSLSQPQPLGIVSITDPVSCAGGSDGSVSLFGQGGSPGYQFAFAGSPFLVSNTFGNLPAGTYAVAVRDTFGCTDSASVLITEPSALSLALLDVTDADCFNAATGSISVQASGGTLPYAYSFDGQNYFPGSTLTSVPAGRYAVRVRDTNGCLAEVQASVSEPSEVAGDIVGVPVQCFGDSNGRAIVTPTGGTPGYTYLWSNGATQSTANNLAPGNYSVIVSDLNGCEATLSIEILEPPQIVMDTLYGDSLRCFGDENAVIGAAASGGYPPLIYAWSNGGSDSIQRDVGAGRYIISISDTSGCFIQDSVEVISPPEIQIDTQITDAFCGFGNGEALAAASGGTPGYTYFWETNPPQFGPRATGLFGSDSGTVYVLQVTDTLGCIEFFDVRIGTTGNPDASFLTDLPPQNPIVIPGLGVQFTNTTTGGAIAYLWEFGDGNISNEINPRHVYEDSGTFEVVLIAYDAFLSCPDTARLSFTLVPPGAIYVPNAFTPNGDGFNDEFYPVGIGVVAVRVDLWDRWGRHLKTLSSMVDRWDGTNANNNPVQEGVYVFVIRATLNDGTEFFKAGTVTLIR
jgi:gliding motility-associated-like protein